MDVFFGLSLWDDRFRFFEAEAPSASAPSFLALGRENIHNRAMRAIEDPFFSETVGEFLNSSRYRDMMRYIAHGDWTLLDHSLHVASLCYEMGHRKGLKLDYRSLLRAAMLHDYYGYDWHKPHPRLHGFRHPYKALANAKRDFPVSPLEALLIKGHMFPLTFWHLPVKKEMRLLLRCDRLSAMYEHRYRKGEEKERSFLDYAFGK